jgi:Cys-Gly metallodipeptidase DUG1
MAVLTINHLLCSELYKKIHYKIDDLKAVTKADVGLSDDVVALLMGRMRFPTLTIHSIDNGNKVNIPGDNTTPPPTVISRKVIGKFSMRYVIFVRMLFAGLNNTCTDYASYSLVPNLTPDNVTPLVEDFINKEFKKLNSKNKLTIKPIGDAEAWVTDYKNASYKAGAQATKV